MFGGNFPRSSADVARLIPGAEIGSVWDGSKLRKRALDIQKKEESLLLSVTIEIKRFV